MKALLVRSQLSAGVVAWALVGLTLTSCRQEPKPAPQPAPTTPGSPTAAPQPAPAGQATAAASTNIEAILKTATTATGSEQYTAIDDLGERHAGAAAVIPELQKLLTNKDAQVRWRTARSLGDYGNQAKSAAAALRSLLTDENPVVQSHAAIALGKVGDSSDETVDALVKAATNANGEVARAAIAALRTLKPGPERVMAALERGLASGDQATTVHALEAIVERGADSVPLLNAALARPTTAYLACAAIEQIGPPAADTVPKLVELIESTKHSQLEIQALLALAAIGPAAKSAGPHIAPLLNHATDATVPVGAAFALGSMGAADGDAGLKEALAKNDNPFLQMISAWALAKIHPEDEAQLKLAVEKLAEGLKSDDAGIRTAAARGLEMLKAPPELVGPALLAVANEPDPDAAANVITALASLGEKVVPKAAEALKKPEFQGLAVKVLTQMGPKASGAVQPLIDAIPGAKPEFRAEIQFALGSIGSAAAPASGVLAEGLSSQDDAVRESALLALRQIGPGAKGAVPSLLKAVDGSDAFESMAAAWAVAAIAPDDAAATAKILPLLTHGLADTDDQNRLESAVALGDLRAAGKPAVEALTKVAETDSSPAVREAASDAVQMISIGQ